MAPYANDGRSVQSCTDTETLVLQFGVPFICGNRSLQVRSVRNDFLFDRVLAMDLLCGIITYTKYIHMANYEDCIVYLLSKAYQKAHGNLRQHLSPYELTPVQHLILEALWEEEGLSAGDIGKRLALDNATLSGILDRMTEKGWTTKAPDETDKRFVRVHLTEKAKTLRTTLVSVRQEANEKILKALNLEEKVLLKRLLKDIRE
jgi:DNA-binding MarR family transcriptional regulator